MDWIGNFIQINDDKSAPGTNDSTSGSAINVSNKKPAVGASKAKVSRSSTAGAANQSASSSSSQLVAQSNEVPRARRGSGSGLALMRSLSASSSSSGSATSTLIDNNINRRQNIKENFSLSGGGSNNSGCKSGSSTSLNNSKTTATNKNKVQKQISSDTEDVRNDLKAAFLVFDVDGDGFITLDEVRAGLQLLGESWSPAELKQVFNKCGSSSSSSAANLNKQQRINIDDFVKLLL